MRARSPKPISNRKKMTPCDRQQHEEPQRVGERVPRRRAAEADVQEEADEEQLLQPPKHVRELLRALVIREHRAEQQRTELGAQPERRERLRRRRSRARRRTARAARRDRSARAARRSRGRVSGTSSSSNAIRRRRLDAHEREQHDGHDVLHDQDADRDAAVDGAQLAVAFEHLGRQHRAREPERDGQHERHPQRQARARRQQPRRRRRP